MIHPKDKVKNEVKSSLLKAFVPVISNRLQSEVDQMTQIVELANRFYTNYDQKPEHKIQLVHYKKELYTYIHSRCEIKSTVGFADAYPELIEALEEVFDQIEESVSQIQSKERFYPAENESLPLKTSKFFKRIFFSFVKIPVLVGNIFRSNKREVVFWDQKILLRNLAKKYFHGELVNSLRSISDLLYKSTIEEYKKIKKWEFALQDVSALDITGRQEALKAYKESLLSNVESEIDVILNNLLERYLIAYEKAGTMELPARKLDAQKVADQITESEKKWGIHDSEWGNTLYALLEKWRSDLDVHILKHQTHIELENFQNAQIKKLIEHIDPEINAIQKFIDSAVNTLTEENESIVKELKKIVYQANKTLDQQLVPKLCEKLSSRNITGLVNKLEIDIKQHVDVIAHDHILVKDDAFDLPIEKSDLNKVSFNELIKFEILSAFQNDLDKIKNGLFTSLEKTTLEVSDLDHIITFSINSSISASTEEKRPDEEVISIAMEGLSRAASRLSAVKKMLEDSLNNNNQKLEEAVNRFCESIMKLTVHENVSQLRLRITKAKTALQAEEVKRDIKQKFEERKKKVFSFVGDTYKKAKEEINFVSNKFILTASKPALTRDVSDFLLESQIAIDKLPLIYRRLYRIEPLDDLELFEGRESEIDAFKEAFATWQKGRYVTTVILGEKWGGFTTFLNYVISKESFFYTIKRWSIDESICQSDIFIKKLCELINKEGVTNQHELIEHLNGGTKQIMILENVQNLYLRKTDGFRAMNTLFEIMSATCKNVFWVATSTIYCWNYLKKAINIHDFFSNEVEMKSLTKEQITNVIWKRNRISGFNIRFLMDEENTKDKKFLKLDEEQQQVVLKEEFFNELNSFSKSNVSLALIFWLMSTRDVDEQTITIGEFSQPNLNFLNVLSMDKIYILLALVLHDGLNAFELSEVLSMDISSCNHTLFSLQKDGIIVFKDNQYTINTVVYRSTIALLKAKNLIH